MVVPLEEGSDLIRVGISNVSCRTTVVFIVTAVAAVRLDVADEEVRHEGRQLGGCVLLPSRVS